MLQLQKVSKSYPNSPRQIIDAISFEVNAGDSIAIVGPSGVGKSTLLNIMSTLDDLDSGTVTFEGTDLSNLSSKKQAEFRNKRMGFVFQQHQLLPQFSLLENVLVPTLALQDKSLKNQQTQRALDLIAQVDLSDHVHKKPSQLSVGECQRTAVARALINKPQILFADEPTGSLDEDSANALVDNLVKINAEQNLSIVMVTHDLNLAQKLKEVYKLERGKLIQF